MKQIVLTKFSNPYLKPRLLVTEDAYLIEGNNWHDNTWGACLCDRCQGKEGMNHLGNILMEVREQIKLE